MYQHLSGFLIRVSGHVLIRYQYCTDTVSRPLRTVETVKTLETVETAETVEAVETFETPASAEIG